MQKIIPNLWFDSQAEEAVKFYTSIFSNSKQGKIARYGKSGAKVSGMDEGSVLTIEFWLDGLELLALNGGPVFKFTPAISFFVYCESEDEIMKLWNKLSENGSILMPLDKYPFSEKFGWVQDRFGVSWQLNLGTSPQKIVPFLMFNKNLKRKASEAIDFYVSQIKNSKILKMDKYGPEDKELEGTVRLASFMLGGVVFHAIDSNIEHAFGFTHAISFIVNCKNQTEIDTLWKNYTTGGEAEPCGWVLDKFGVSWQIVPDNMDKLLTQKDPQKVERKMEALLKMQKIDIQSLLNA